MALKKETKEAIADALAEAIHEYARKHCVNRHPYIGSFGIEILPGGHVTIAPKRIEDGGVAIDE